MPFLRAVIANLMRLFVPFRGVAVGPTSEASYDADEVLYTTGHPINVNSTLGTKPAAHLRTNFNDPVGSFPIAVSSSRKWDVQGGRHFLLSQVGKILLPDSCTSSLFIPLEMSYTINVGFFIMGKYTESPASLSLLLPINAAKSSLHSVSTVMRI